MNYSKENILITRKWKLQEGRKGNVKLRKKTNLKQVYIAYKETMFNSILDYPMPVIILIKEGIYLLKFLLNLNKASIQTMIKSYHVIENFFLLIKWKLSNFLEY